MMTHQQQCARKEREIRCKIMILVDKGQYVIAAAWCEIANLMHVIASGPADANYVLRDEILAAISTLTGQACRFRRDLWAAIMTLDTSL